MTLTGNKTSIKTKNYKIKIHKNIIQGFNEFKDLLKKKTFCHLLQSQQANKTFFF